MAQCEWHACQKELPPTKQRFCCEAHKNNFHVDRRRKEIKRLAVEYKGVKCKVCDYNKCQQALEFHHLDPSQKDFRISDGLTRSWDKTKVELDKCILLCSNCHKEYHAGALDLAPYLVP